MAYDITLSGKSNITKLRSHSNHQIYNIMCAWGNCIPMSNHVYIITHCIISPLLYEYILFI